ncbi:MAG: hypothetical protein ACM3TR_20925 [Caulobacteraceae bacterium]
MSKRLYRRYIKNFDVNLLDCEYLGKGHNGVVYRLPEGKVIKICFDAKSCIKEYRILKKIDNNRHFPRVHGMQGNYMIRDYVAGVSLKHYIKKNGMDRELAHKLIELLDEFRKLRFTKLDVRCRDIYVRPDGNLSVIDPKKCFSKKRDFPRHLAKGLYKLGVLDTFMSVVEEEKPRLYRHWNDKIREYMEQIYPAS